jgi:CHASE1-domain containing sensor protein
MLELISAMKFRRSPNNNEEKNYQENQQQQRYQISFPQPLTTTNQ